MSIDPSKYQEITKLINNTYSGVSPSPINQISILNLKNSPVTRTMLAKIIKYCWKHRYFPTKWKNSVTILAYENGSTSDPRIYRPITLQSVMNKIFTAIIKKQNLWLSTSKQLHRPVDTKRLLVKYLREIKHIESYLSPQQCKKQTKRFSCDTCWSSKWWSKP